MRDSKWYAKEDVYKIIQEVRDYYEQKLREKPNAIQIISLAISCFVLGVSIAKLFLK